AEKLRPQIEAENNERIKEYWNLWENSMFDMQKANASLLNAELSHEDFFVDLCLRDIMPHKVGMEKIGVFDVDNTLLYDGNLTCNPYGTGKLGLMDVGVNIGAFNSPYELLVDYKDISDFSANGEKILSMDGYDKGRLAKMDMHLCHGFAKIYNLHKDGGVDGFVETKLHFLKDICEHPEKTCIPYTYFHDLMLLASFYDKLVFITLSDNDIANALFGIAEQIMPEEYHGKITTIGSSFSVKRKKIDIDDKNILKDSVCLPFGPKKIGMLNSCLMCGEVSEKMRVINGISNAFESDPTIVDDMVWFEDVCGLDYPIAAILYGGKDTKNDICLTFTSDNIEDFSGLTIGAENKTKRTICNFVENEANQGWCETIRTYANNNGFSFNKITKATDVLVFELFGQSIETMFFNYGFEGIKYICSGLDKIRPKVYEYRDALENKDDSGDALGNIKDSVESLRDNIIDKYHDGQYDGMSGKNATLFLHLLNLEIRDIKDIKNGYGKRLPGSRLFASGLWNVDMKLIEKIKNDAAVADDIYLKPLSEVSGRSESGPQVVSVPESLKSAYGKNNNDIFNRILLMLVNPQESYDFFARHYSGSEGTLSAIKSATLKNEMFMHLMN
ncbi:MAG: hypothetical protein KAS90_05000, partial [Candidatus Aenigmarchaeota archaeon]|nr:hypothetical protein [Candidatus Aenigmarchaeota archaeon]